MKRKLILLSAVVICIAIAAAGTLAYFTADTTAHNVITSGGVDIGIREWADEEMKTPFEGPVTGKMPGQKAVKIVKILNEPEPEKKTSAQAWIRAKVEIEIEYDEETIKALKDKDPNFVEHDPDTGLITIETSSRKWAIGGDGYYYYMDRVNPGEYTEALIEKVKFDEAMGNEYQSCTVNIIITAEAVQTANNGDTVKDALGWPGSDPAPTPTPTPTPGEGEGEGEESLPLQGEVARRAGGVDNESAATTTPQSADADSSPDKGSQDPIDPENP